MRALSDLTTLVVLNILALLCALPVITAGASLAALHYCVMKLRDGDGDLPRTFLHQWKMNLKSTLPVTAIYLLAIVAVYLDVRIFLHAEGELSFFLIPVYAVCFLLVACFCWIFPLMARFENTFFNTWKNTFILAVGALPKTLGMMFFWFVILFVTTQVTACLPLFFLLGIALPAYLGTYFYYPTIRNLIDKGTKEEVEEE